MNQNKNPHIVRKAIVGTALIMSASIALPLLKAPRNNVARIDMKRTNDDLKQTNIDIKDKYLKLWIKGF
jgi:hypothetical protein